MSEDIWITYEAKKWLEEWLKPDMVGAEYGSGNSTIWLAKRINKLYSIEHNKTYYKKISKLIEKNNLNNVVYIYKNKPVKYIESFKKLKENSLDFVFIDGIERLECLNIIKYKVKRKGIFIIDNTDRHYWYNGDKLLDEINPIEIISFFGEGKGGVWKTTIIRRI